jgi:hypothetical protein
MISSGENWLDNSWLQWNNGHAGVSSSSKILFYEWQSMVVSFVRLHQFTEIRVPSGKAFLLIMALSKDMKLCHIAGSSPGRKSSSNRRPAFAMDGET